jgi:HSP20 family protein
MVEITFKSAARKSNYLVLEEIHRLNTERPNQQLNPRSHIWRPPTDVYEIGNAIIVRVEIAGMGDMDFSIILDGRNLHVSGNRPDISERRAYHQMEIRFGEFFTEVDLPYSVEAEKIEAVYQNGFLQITLPAVPLKKVVID